MLRYLLYLPFMILCMVFCYLTNWIVVLFADEVGELHGFLHLWQTWDNSVYSRQEVLEVVPKWLSYDYDSKYEVYESASFDLRRMGRTRKYIRLKDGAKFTLIEKIKRYICGVLWLYRNCAYGFAFYWFGTDCDAKNLKKVVEKNVGNRAKTLYVDTSKSLAVRPFRFKCNTPFCKKLRWDIYVGWKLETTKNGNIHSMIANRFFAIKKV